MALTDEINALVTDTAADARARWAAGDQSFSGLEGTTLQTLAIAAKAQGIIDPVGELYAIVQRKVQARSFDSVNFSAD